MNIYQETLKKYWGYTKFRPFQEDVILSVASGRDTLALMPTGAGKSITFQVPALAKEGLCLVITPLIALMKDQVESLHKRGIKAAAVYSGMTKDEIDIALNNCIYGDYKFLYLSPERLNTEIFQVRMEKMRINLIAVDEAHCISQWGYDFRPAYLRIAEIRKKMPDVPVLALTATATPTVAQDIQEKLCFKEPNIIKSSFERKNLIYVVRETEDKLKYLIKIFRSVRGSAIVYVRTRKKTREIAKFLKENDITADHYHAGLSDELKNYKEKNWKIAKTRVMVATNAFGMGIDKPDVRIVVHIDLPDSLEEYFQEAGRAGRDGKKSYAVLLYNNSDNTVLKQRISNTFPGIDIIKRIYEALGNYLEIPIGAGKNQSYNFNIVNFALTFNVSILTVFNSLKILQQHGYIEYSDDLNLPSMIHFTVGRNDLYKFQVENPEFDSFIKLLLRSYTGVFTDYANIDEEVLSKRFNTNKEQIFEYLKRLSRLQIIKYIPRRNTPFIIYTQERLSTRSLFISHDLYHRRRQVYTEQIESVLRYATNNKKCRSKQLLAYFGETNTQQCRKCDVCQQVHELNLKNYEYEYIYQQIHKNLKENTLKLDELVDNIKYNKEKVIKVVRWLLDNSELRYIDGHKLELRKK